MKVPIRFYNFYLNYANLFEMVDISLGRQAIFAGVGTAQSMAASLNPIAWFRLKVFGYYGALPSPGQKFEMISDQKNNNMFGAQLIGMPMDFARVSLSYMQKNIKPETYWAPQKRLPFQSRYNRDISKCDGRNNILAETSALTTTWSLHMLEAISI